MDELWEFMTLLQTRKMGHQAFILMYGSDYWKRLINFDLMVQSGTVSEDDLRLLHFVDSPEQALALIRQKLRRNRAMRAALRHPFP